jgi:NADH-quinone oxidoreductase subunit B/C/D
VAVDEKVSLPIAREGIESERTFEHPLYTHLLKVPGLSIGVTTLDALLTWGVSNSLWVFPMATSCCGIELMAAAASRVDLDRMGTIVRATPRQGDVMVVAGTITVKMAARVKKLWDQMPEPKWVIAMGSCAISGDFYRDLYPVVPGIDTFLPVDVYIPGCPPNPEGLMHGLQRLQEKVRAQRVGKFTAPELRPELLSATAPSIPRLNDPARDPKTSERQTAEGMETADSAVEKPEAVADAHAPEAPAEAPAAAPAAADAAAPPATWLEALYTAHGAKAFPKDAPPLISADRHVSLARSLQERGYKQLVYIAATHWLAGRGRAGADANEKEHFEVSCAVRTVGRGSELAWWSVRLEVGESLPTLTGVYAGADWQEREQWDLVGVKFSGHPDLRRLMMPENWEGHPLRKDYAADTHRAPWR